MFASFAVKLVYFLLKLFCHKGSSTVDKRHSQYFKNLQQKVFVQKLIPNASPLCSPLFAHFDNQGVFSPVVVSARNKKVGFKDLAGEGQCRSAIWFSKVVHNFVMHHTRTLTRICGFSLWIALLYTKANMKDLSKYSRLWGAQVTRQSVELIRATLWYRNKLSCVRLLQSVEMSTFVAYYYHYLFSDAFARQGLSQAVCNFDGLSSAKHQRSCLLL